MYEFIPVMFLCYFFKKVTKEKRIRGWQEVRANAPLMFTNTLYYEDYGAMPHCCKYGGFGSLSGFESLNRRENCRRHKKMRTLYIAGILFKYSQVSARK
jgi:hypothetical protein